MTQSCSSRCEAMLWYAIWLPNVTSSALYTRVLRPSCLRHTSTKDRLGWLRMLGGLLERLQHHASDLFPSSRSVTGCLCQLQADKNDVYLFPVHFDCISHIFHTKVDLSIETVLSPRVRQTPLGLWDALGSQESLLQLGDDFSYSTQMARSGRSGTVEAPYLADNRRLVQSSVVDTCSQLDCAPAFPVRHRNSACAMRVTSIVSPALPPAKQVPTAVPQLAARRAHSPTALAREVVAARKSLYRSLVCVGLISSFSSLSFSLVPHVVENGTLIFSIHVSGVSDEVGHPSLQLQRSRQTSSTSWDSAVAG